MLQIHIKGSKMDQWRQGTRLVVGHTNSHICPVKSILAYIAVRGFQEGPLFLKQNGAPLTQQSLISSVRTTLRKAGCSHYSGHSFRIGAATTASAKGIDIPETTIQALGRWSSDSYKRYIRLPRKELANISQLLHD
jgi:site-specific recombinase XerD